MTLLAALLWGALARGGEPEDMTALIAQRWAEVRAESQWQSPTVRERKALREGIEQLVFAAEQCPEPRIRQIRTLLADAGFTVSRVHAREAELLIVEEQPERRRGGGLFVIRCGPARPLAIQAPHAFFDLHTRDIAWQLFAEGELRLGMWNTVHRYRSRPDETREEDIHPADVSHEFGSFFHAATVAASVGEPGLRFVQVHGFAAGRIDRDLVISSGRAARPPLSFANRLGDALGSSAVFGTDTRVLGGTQNVQGRFLSGEAEGRFLHLELSEPARLRLAASADDRRALLDALAGPWR